MKSTKKENYMREQKRIQEMMLLLTEIWEHIPDLRFNQLIHNLQATFYQKKKKGVVCWNYEKHNWGFLKPKEWALNLVCVEDEEFIEFLKEELRLLKQNDEYKRNVKNE